MRHFIIVAALIALPTVAGCTSTSCSIPTDVPFTTEISANESSPQACPADVVTGIEAISGATMTFDSSESCSNVELAFQFTDPSTSATCTATGAVAFSSFQTGSGADNGGSGDGSVDVMCSDGTNCTQAIAVVFSEE